MTMRRRDLFKAAAALALLPAMGGRALAAVGVTMRRVRPGDAAWPKAADWQALKQAVGGNLLQPKGLIAEAAGAPGADLDNPFFIGDQPSGTQVSGWFKAWTPAPSAYAVAAHRGEDVAAAVDFARRHKLRLVVKGGAHSYQGTSNAPDSLLVWTRPMRKVEMIAAFVPAGCEGKVAPVPAVSVEAGAVWIDVYDTVTTKGGRYAQGGGCTTVGVAGHVQSGGFGSFSKRYGTAAGSLLEAEIVTADGTLRRVNPCQDPELFWGVKGGGGGSLGVVTKLILRTHDLPETFGAAMVTVKANSDAAFRKLIGRFVDHYADTLFNPHWGESVQVGGDNRLQIQMVCQGLDDAAIAADWKPLLDWVAASPRDFALEGQPILAALPSRHWWDAESWSRTGHSPMVSDARPGVPARQAWWRGDQEQVGMFLHGYESLWLPAALLEPASRAALADALMAGSRHMSVGLHFNKGLAGADPAAIERARDTATNPEALTAFALAIIATGGGSRYPGLAKPDTDDAKAARHAGDVDAATAALAPLAPQGGSYVSESNFFNRAWAKSFWGGNYPRLLAAKRRYDPDGLFFVHHGVGSEDWSADGFDRRST